MIWSSMFSSASGRWSADALGRRCCVIRARGEPGREAHPPQYTRSDRGIPSSAIRFSTAHIGSPHLRRPWAGLALRRVLDDARQRLPPCRTTVSAAHVSPEPGCTPASCEPYIGRCSRFCPSPSLSGGRALGMESDFCNNASRCQDGLPAVMDRKVDRSTLCPSRQARLPELAE